MTAGSGQSATVDVAPQAEALRLTVAGRLNVSTVPKVWRTTTDTIQRAAPRRVIVDGAGITYCDGAGLAYFAQVRRTAAVHGVGVDLEGLAPDLRELLHRASLPDPLAPQLRRPKSLDFVSHVGKAVSDLAEDLRAMIGFLGELLAALCWALLHPRRLRWRDLLGVAEKAGVNALPVVCLLGFLIGVILAFQSAIPLQRLGAIDVIPSVVSIAVVRELGPLITAVLLAGRTGSAFAAEIGTMKVTEEVNALQTLGLDPVRFLVVPRVLAAMAVTPVLCVFCNVMGLLGGYLVMTNFGFNFAEYASAARSAVEYKDLVSGVGKTVVFALIIGGVGCLRGLRTGAGPGAVGDTTTRAVVAGIVLVILADGIFGFVFYYSGI